MRPNTPAISKISGVGITLSGLSKSFAPDREVLHGIDLKIEPGAFVAVLGPSGCGKSTLLRLIAGLERPTSGDLSVQSPAEVAYVFQDAHLLPWRNVSENVQLPLEFRGVPAEERRLRAEETLERVGLSDSLNLFSNQLSGGMKMRVSLARALVTRPTLLILDEPFAALDEVTRQRLDEDLRGLWLAFGMTVLFVTHSITEAAFLSERVILLSRKSHGIAFEQVLAWPEPRKAGLRISVAFSEAVQNLQQAFESLA